MASDFLDVAGESVEGEVWRRRAASAGALIVAVLLIALVAMVAVSSRERDAAAAAERRSYDVMLLTRGVEMAIARSEASLGRFVISGDRSVGAAYSEEWRRAGLQLEQLRRLTAESADQAPRVARLRQLYDQRGQELARAAERTADGQGMNGISLFYRAGQSDTVQAIDRTLRQVAGAERALLAERARLSASVASHSNFLARLLSATGLLLVGAAIVLGWLTVQAITQRRKARRAAEAHSDRAEQLEMAVAQRTRELSDANTRLQQEMVEREAAEAQLRQVQKMEAVGQLTGGIAHDFNNMLAVVVGGLDLARRRLAAETEEVGRHIEQAMEGANRAAALTRRLLSFARSEPLLPEAVAPRGLIAGMSDLLDRTLGERIRVETRLAEDIWPVWVDRHQLENAVLNLAVNARDAMDGEGRLLVTARNLSLRAGEVGEAPAGDYVCISVVDDGCGIPPEVLDRVFEPFFTTKPVGKGTGLGLSQIFGFVRESGGDVLVDSVVGSGTAVSLYLPRHVGAEPALPAAAPEPLILPAASTDGLEGAVILVVEDDARVLGATLGGLQELGYRPIACGNGEEALTVLAQRDDIQLVISDVVMPGMTGPQLIRRVSELYPHLGVLFVTGYVGDGEAGDLAGYDLLRKPFTISALERAVAAAFAKADRISEPRLAPRAAAAG